MPSRLQKPRPLPTPSRESSIPLQQDIETQPTYLYTTSSDASPRTKPAYASYGPTNTMNTYSTTPDSKFNPYTSPSFSPNGNKITSTIRTVPSFEAPSDASSLDSPSARNSGFSSSVNSNVSGTSYHSQQPTHSTSTVRLKPQSPGLSPPLPISQNGNSYMSTSDAASGESEMTDEPALSLQVPETNTLDDRSNRALDSSPQWDGAVGKAGLGKTGRVINKLVSDNEALKRDIQIERLKAEEARQAARLIEDKMERMVADYETRLLEANVTKTLLSRKERQVEHLQSAVELEKKRTADAQERERIWREEVEKSRRDTKVQVEEANMHAALMDGRYNAISSHWKDQGGEVKRAMEGLDDKIKSLVKERKTDDEKISVLRDLCDQQDGNIRDLQRQKDEIARQFEAYKREQEQALKSIKTKARDREDEQQRSLEEAKRVLGQLKWALNVKQTVKDAQ
ncbi:uncharacterized protein GGS22DRAFT_69486 [Annulohypoxylon maeteangense]|uniref:uncharacterized protein n=1 Tax=Annulohypoxylon maeteangense TaxID=1927788 RepID=UPI002007A876|nr:uncharacterized protein GGS22DRAFT_69486 [Annulohypoxylon maeteangense]KAI0889278.1 hypothetical protein GGS22DRAFT_69486 [Annulohypoxylon maeteangense]